MDVSLVPFGNARFRFGKLECQHGVDECKVNSFEQCAISLYPSFSDYWPYYLCVETAAASCGEGAGPCVLKHTEKCAKTASLDYEKLSACVNDPTEALKLQHEFDKLTPSDHKYTPWVVVDGKVSPSAGDKLIAEVCKAYKGTKPTGCAQAEAEAAHSLVELEAARASNATCTATW